MTVPLSPGSSRGIAAARFGAELAKAMRARKVGQIRLAEAAGCARSAIPAWRSGRNLPRVGTAAKLAEVLEWPKLTEIARSGRTLTCARCGRPFVNNGGGPARYCSPDCRNVDQQLRRPISGAELAAAVRSELERKAGVKGGIPKAPLVAALDHYARRERGRTQRVDRLADQVAGYRFVIDEMCHSCEPEGVCRTASCPLRPVSPLALQHGAGVREVRAVEGPWGSHREAQLVAIRAANAERWSRPGEREAMADRSKARFAAMSDEERTEHRRRISAGRASHERHTSVTGDAESQRTSVTGGARVTLNLSEQASQEVPA